MEEYSFTFLKSPFTYQTIFFSAAHIYEVTVCFPCCSFSSCMCFCCRCCCRTCCCRGCCSCARISSWLRRKRNTCIWISLAHFRAQLTDILLLQRSPRAKSQEPRQLKTETCILHNIRILF